MVSSCGYGGEILGYIKGQKFLRSLGTITLPRNMHHGFKGYIQSNRRIPVKDLPLTECNSDTIKILPIWG